jgi:hypothetical protein
MLKICEIETRLGAVYRFPDVDGEVYVPKGAGLNAAVTGFTIINASGACLVIPWRIIRQIRLDNEVIWTGPEVCAA